MRADRLIQALLVLQARGTVTAAQLAEALEVSVPTARRDLQALLVAGIPIYPRPGRGGGWELIGGARTDLTGLTGPEAFALVLQLSRAGAESPAAARAERKMRQALPRPFREAAERVAASTRVGSPWGRADDADPPASAGRLQEALAAQRLVGVAYRDREPIDLVPLVVGRRGDLWYLLAAPVRPGTDVADTARIRTYRIDRIREVTLRTSPGRIPGGFSAEASWREMERAVEARRGAVAAIVDAAPDVVDAFCGYFGRYARVLGEATEGRTRVEVRAQDAGALAEQLSGWSAVVHVIEPDAVRRALADIGARLVATYGG
jgi:predicted DNA-binding transcriptional regulator YafY